MQANFPPDTRGIWPYEKNALVNFTSEHSSYQSESWVEVTSLFKSLITELFDETVPEALYANPDSQHVLAFSVTPDESSEVVVVVVKQGLGSDLSDQIIVQDRLFGKIRDEYIYMSTDGSEGEIVRIRCGDIAAHNHNIANNLVDSSAARRIGTREQQVGIAELEAVMALAVMGEAVDLSANQAEQLNYPQLDTKYDGDINLLIHIYTA